VSWPTLCTVGAPRLTVIGLDSATFDVIDPLVAQGELPNLGRLLATGACGILRSTTHPLTPQAWATMVTGVNAGRHGLWDFVERDESGYGLHVVNGSHRRAPAVWDYLSAAQRRCGIVNVPFTCPAPVVSGFAIAGFDADVREEGMTYPPSLLEELRGRFGPLVFDHKFPLDAGGNVDLELVRRASEQKVESALWLSERFEPELLFVVFMAADHIHHLCWPEWEAEGASSRVADVYRVLDSAVGALVEAADGQDVMVVSDHGGGALEGVLNLNAWLAEHGYLAYAEGGVLLREGQLGRRLVHNLFELRRKLPPAVRSRARRRLGRTRERVYELRRYSIVDWSRTRAFAYGTFGNVVINVRGRERHGIVDADDYERVREELAELALNLRAPDGGRMVTAVHRREALFEGPELERLPDLVVEFDEYRWLGKGNLKSRTPTIWDEIDITGTRRPYAGSHRLEGILALAGPSAGKGRVVAADLQDVAPTLLYLLGEPVPTALEGRVIEEAIDHSLLDARPPEYREAADVRVGATAGREAGASLEERLRGLGYIE
jgi:predicted AlkP superfamily phosphohydrolase/phosphomutase